MGNGLPRKPGMPPIANFTPVQTIALGMTAVAATLGGFYMLLSQKQSRKDASGTNPYYEYLVKRVISPGGNLLPIGRVEAREPVLPAPAKEHNSRHSTVENYKTSPEYVSGVWSQPTPQRAKHVGSSVPYTKSPDYAKSYEKTSTEKSEKARSY